MKDKDESSILDTVDTFIACVPQGDSRAILVYHRRHGGREYVRLRVWHRHRQIGKWYPDKLRRFVVSLEHAEALGQAMIQAAQGQTKETPDWLAGRERERERRGDVLKLLNAPADVLKKASRRRRS